MARRGGVRRFGHRLRDGTRNSRLDAQTGPTHDDLGSPQAPRTGNSGFGQQGAAVSPSAGETLSGAANPNNTTSSAPANVDIQTEDLHAKISSDETNNAIVVYATPRDYAVVEDALRKLDVAPNQVMIEAAIVEVTLNDQLQYGVQWQFGGTPSVATLAATPINGLSIAPTNLVQGFSYFYSHGTIAASLTALEGNLTHINP